MVIRDDEAALTADIIRLASEYGRYGYRRITALLRREGWTVNFKRVERIWRREGLKVPQKQPKRGRLWFNDGFCVRRRPQHKGHVWSYDFVADRTHDGRAFRMLTVIDEYTRECLAIHVQRSLKHDDVLAVLTDLFTRHGPPEYIRSDNGSEFTAIAVREWLEKWKVQTLYITPGSPWENGYNESFNGKLRDELLNGEIGHLEEQGFGASIEANFIIGSQVRLHRVTNACPQAYFGMILARISGGIRILNRIRLWAVVAHGKRGGGSCSLAWPW